MFDLTILILSENDEDNESNWDAEDDNLLLEEIKSKKDDGKNKSVHFILYYIFFLFEHN